MYLGIGQNIRKQRLTFAREREKKITLLSMEKIPRIFTICCIIKWLLRVIGIENGNTYDAEKKFVVCRVSAIQNLHQAFTKINSS